MLSFISNLFGKKSDRDIKEVMPYLNKIHDAEKNIVNLSNDELRAKTAEFKQRIADYISAEENQKAELRKQITDNPQMDIDDKEAIWQQVDKIDEGITSKIEDVLDQILPEAFAVVKETARRFTENEIIEVSTTDHDRDLATRFDNINILGDKTEYANSWTAGGVKIQWNMIHYDVQLIGGVMLHKGKISEMATGEGKTLVATLPV